MSKNRKPIMERLVTDTKQIPTWLEKGMEAVRLAPSAKNSQKTVFEYKKGVLIASVPNNYEFDLVDLGIEKKHFEVTANGIFELGNGSAFTLKNGGAK